MATLFPTLGFAVVLLTVWAAVEDLLFRRIRNVVVLSIFIITLLATGLALGRGYSLPSLGLGEGGLFALAILVVGFLFQVKGWVGAGDVKVMTALAFWFGSHAGTFLIVTSLLGGILVLALPLLRWLEIRLALLYEALCRLWRLENMPEPLCLKKEPAVEGLPYGPAIALGAILVTLL